MRLYLSSYRIGSDRAVLHDLIGGSGRAGIILNALDLFADDRTRHLERERRDLDDLGLDSEEIDLRAYFDASEKLRSHLEDFDLLWVVGGNTFVLARAMIQAGFDDAIHDRLVNNAILYAGYSAGICVTGPDLDGCHLMDDPDGLPDGYATDVKPLPLGWIPWRIVPHFRSDHPEAELADIAVKHLVDSSLPFQTLRDGQAFVIDGEREFLS